MFLRERIHDLYSLRRQVEILFKTWKSLFQIDRCKEIKLERLECHFYGQLIAILFCSSTFRNRKSGSSICRHDEAGILQEI